MSTTPVQTTFEDGLARLEEIAGLVARDRVSVSEMCDLFEEGKGLQHALTQFLDTQRGRIEEIDRGENVRPVQIVPADHPAAPTTADAAPPAPPAPSGGYAPFDSSPPPAPGTAAPAPGNDDIPF